MSGTVYLIRGVPGAGKSTLSAGIAELCDRANISCVRCEADDFFVDKEGNYKYDSDYILDAHEECFDKYILALLNKTEVVIVSNTSVREKHVDRYRLPARQHGYKFISLILENRHGNKSIHDVPNSEVDKMKSRFQISL